MPNRRRSITPFAPAIQKAKAPRHADRARQTGQSLAALFISKLEFSVPASRKAVNSGSSPVSGCAACLIDPWVAGRECRGQGAEPGPPACSTPGLVGRREPLLNTRLDRLPGSPTAPTIPAAPVPQIDADHHDLQRTCSVNGTRIQLHPNSTMKLPFCQTLHRCQWHVSLRLRRVQACHRFLALTFRST